jgi:hypothetical protein
MTTPGIDLQVSGSPLTPAGTPPDATAQLQVTLRNTGTTRAGGAIEVVTPPGVDVVAFPAACRSHRRIGAGRERCELGHLAAGQEQSAVFGLAVSAAARAELPLTVAVHGYLAPAGGDGVETRFDYRITAPPVDGEAPLPTAAPASPVAQATIVPTDLNLRRQSSGGLLPVRRLSSIPFIAAVVGLVAVVGSLVVFSLRRPVRDGGRDDELRPDEIEEVVLVPAQRVTDENRAMALPRSSIPRALTPPRPPPGPAAGPDLRDAGNAEREDERH